jgi:hypothetical protein
MTGPHRRGPESIARALHEAAQGFEPPDHQLFHDRAALRVRQIKRRRALGGGLAGLVAAGAAGILAVGLLGGPNRPGTVAPTATHTPNNAGSVTPAEVLQTLLGSLPASAVRIPDSQGDLQWADGPDVNKFNGDWYVSAGAILKSPSPTGSSVSLTVMHGAQTTTCAEAEARSSMDTCGSSHLDGGTLITDEAGSDPSAPLSEPTWQYYWLSPSGNEIDLSIVDVSVSDFALPQQAAIDVVTDPGWDRLADRLPGAVCRGGTLSELPSTGSTPFTDDAELRCSTDGRTYPMN